MRRGVGIGGLQRQAAANKTFKDAGEVLAVGQMEQLQGQLTAFKGHLEAFAKQHRKEISKNAHLRSHFQKMCAAIGVDPLVSSKGFWAQIMGVGDFYYELGIQVVESCLLLQDQTGGLADVSLVKRQIERMRGSNAVEITDDDLARAVDTLKPLGSGFAIINLGSRKVIQSVPFELSPDASILLKAAESHGHVSHRDVPHWQDERFARAIKALIFDGLVWMDDQHLVSEVERATLYWFPALFSFADL